MPFTRHLAYVILLFGLVPGGSLAAETVLYVSPTGSDANPGTEAQPLATLQKAQNLLRQATGKKTVFLRGGAHYLPRTLVLEAQDSGTAGAPITWRAFPGETAIVSGGRKLDLQWQTFKAGIVQAKVPQDLVSDQLFLEGQRQPMARYPNFNAAERVFNGFAADAFSKERAARWQHPETGFIHAMHSHAWGGFHYRITGKTADGEVTYEGGTQNNRRMGMHAEYRFVENIFEELDAPGEWFHDTTTGTLYFLPPAGLDLARARFESVQLRHLIECRGSEKQPVKHVTFHGLVFRHTARTFMDTREPLLRSDWTTYRGGAVFFTGCEDCVVKDCDLDQVGGNGIFASGYNRRLVIKGCAIDKAGANSVAFVGSSEAVRSPLMEYGQTLPLEKIDLSPGPKTNDYPADCLVEDCLLVANGRVEKQTAGVQIAMAQRITVRHCSIYDCPRAGINVGDGCWGGHVIDGNDVFDTVKETGDHGSFNSWGRDRYWVPNIAEISRRVAAHPGLPFLDCREPITLSNNRWRCDHGWDIDLDDGSSNYRIVNNVCLSGGIKLREGFGRTVENNIMVNNTFHPHVWPENTGDVFARNIVMRPYAPIGMPIVWGKLVDHNLLPSEEVLAASRAAGRDEHSRAGDPAFTDSGRGDFSVRETSPAVTVGFENFPMNQFGVKSPRLRERARAPAFALRGGQPVARRIDGLREWRGARIKNVTGLGEVSAAGLSGETGVLVVEVPEGSEAGKAGLQSKDVILRIGDKPVAEIADLLVGCQAVGQEGMVIEVYRDQQKTGLRLPPGSDMLLSAATARAEGPGPRPHYDADVDFLGGWTNEQSHLVWQTTIPRPGIYTVEMIVSCPDTLSGSEFDVEIGSQSVAGKVPSTGGWSSFTVSRVGEIMLEHDGKMNVVLRPRKKQGAALMNLRGLMLTPVLDR